VSEIASCPYCGSPTLANGPGGEREHSGERGIDSLYREVRRIREIAESRDADDLRRVAELTREVAELRATVARLRGSGMGGSGMGGSGMGGSAAGGPAMAGPAVSAG
jgi:hypothetical protein